MLNADRRNSQRLGTARMTLTPEAEPHTLILAANLGNLQWKIVATRNSYILILIPPCLDNI
jgi:hypothetical protein